jgi:hypothetical protein
MKRVYQFHQENMYCHMCLTNIASMLSCLKDDIATYSIDMNTKMIRVESVRDLNEKDIHRCINLAVSTGITLTSKELRMAG